jgi:cysteine-rich repeat protein
MEMRKYCLDKKGAFFSADALLALLIILFVILAVGPSFESRGVESEVHVDSLQILSTLETRELEATVLGNIKGFVSSEDQSVLESVAELQALGEDDFARDVVESVFDSLDITENIGIWVDGELVYSKNETPFEDAEDVKVARKSITGVFGENTTGYSARAFLSSDARSEYFYLGGYVGDGNLSMLVNISGGVNFVEAELVINDGFELFVNGVSQGNYGASPSQTEPGSYDIPVDDFVNGTNLIEFRGDSLFVAGGFVKINYNADVSFTDQEVIYLPGINGIVNLYDGIYLPNNVSSMEITLHMLNNVTPLFVNLGNITLYENVTGDTDEFVVLNDSFLRSKFGGDYDSLEEKTLPLRIGFENVTIFGITKLIDVFSVTDLSGSMSGSKMTNAKSANYDLVEFILNTTGNRVGLVGYETVARDNDFHELSTNEATMDNLINTVWDADGYTCICCGIEKAVNNFFPNSSVVVGEGLEVYYDFNSGLNADDLSGNGNDGTLHGNGISFTGINGTGLSFDGGDYISLPDILDMEEGTISIWIDPDRDDDQTIFDASNNNEYFFLDIDGGEDLRFHLEDDTDADFQDSEQDVTGIDSDGWHHVAIVWRFGGIGSSTELYLDGSLIDQDNDLAGDVPDFLNPYIGMTRSSYQTNWDYEGDLDEFRLYERTLSLAEIQGLGDTSPSCGNSVVEVGEVCDGGFNVCSSGGFDGKSNCNSGCDGWLTCNTTSVCGDGVVNQGEGCDYGDTVSGDGCSSTCQIEDRFRSIIVMSDGEANRGCSGNNADSVDRQEAVDAACDAYNNYGIVTHAVGFGSGADETTLQNIASCGNGDYYFSSTSDLSTVFLQIAQNIITEYAAQTINATGDFNTVLYPDSNIRLDYDREVVPFGFIVTGEKEFSDESSGSFDIDSESEVLSANLVSYSGSRWTQSAVLNGNEFYNLSDYGLKYIFLGDPYRVSLPASDVVVGGSNYVSMTTGNGISDVQNGSEYNKMIYTVVRNISAFSGISPKIEGCNWTIQLSNDENLTVAVPQGYNESDECYYVLGDFDPPADSEDGYKQAVYTLLKDIDFDDDGKVDVFFNRQDLEIVLSDLTGIPFPWELEVQVRRWI